MKPGKTHRTWDSEKGKDGKSTSWVPSTSGGYMTRLINQLQWKQSLSVSTNMDTKSIGIPEAAKTLQSLLFILEIFGIHKLRNSGLILRQISGWDMTT